MDKRKLQAVINRIKDDVNYYKKEILFLNKNAEELGEQLHCSSKVTNFEIRIDEANRILRQLEYLKESIK